MAEREDMENKDVCVMYCHTQRNTYGFISPNPYYEVQFEFEKSYRCVCENDMYRVFCGDLFWDFEESDFFDTFALTEEPAFPMGTDDFEPACVPEVAVPCTNPVLKELVYESRLPQDRSARLYHCPDTGEFFILKPHTLYSKKLYHCVFRYGEYQPTGLVEIGSIYRMDGKVVTAVDVGEIVDEAAKERYDNQEITLYRLKPEFAHLPIYEKVPKDKMYATLFYNLEHFEKVKRKRKDVVCERNIFYYDRELGA